ncbi:uncharacterized protein PGTG_02303 [Puccinia graminis f. sp. tritici CRL 75-36-700-3]|uniref:Uncharacterized protein n=1 Tax=Puccinia graminis f. sp. tritici (strain CRL 75-36-700-3 / race SCCL) TaxID=418459 RepID=E3JXR7_PUCGT|nr:uncharacterized protein PGTG_02303 [Puccinia graminis f. sp. tritici CRL 75-36-700-3]EFP76842.1 hypothetical protein PGTG_02303 [Puccinia graminis f. sp. tritici CRL 75-36-700-3]
MCWEWIIIQVNEKDNQWIKEDRRQEQRIYIVRTLMYYQ